MMTIVFSIPISGQLVKTVLNQSLLHFHLQTFKFQESSSPKFKQTGVSHFTNKRLYVLQSKPTCHRRLHFRKCLTRFVALKPLLSQNSKRESMTQDLCGCRKNQKPTSNLRKFGSVNTLGSPSIASAVQLPTILC